MASYNLVVGLTDGVTASLEITRAWAGILRKGDISSLTSIVKGQGLEWNKVIRAEIQIEDPDYGFSIHNLFDC
jgi:hypothetical protein